MTPLATATKGIIDSDLLEYCCSGTENDETISNCSSDEHSVADPLSDSESSHISSHDIMCEKSFSSRRIDNFNDISTPMSRAITNKLEINFMALENFIRNSQENDAMSRNYYRPATCTSFSRHRPLVPQEMLYTDNDFVPSMGRINEKFEEKHQTRISERSLSGEDEFDVHSLHKGKEFLQINERRLSFTMDRFTFFTVNEENTKYAPTLGSLLQGRETFKKLFDPSNSVWWLDCLDPREEELKTLGKAFGIHPLTVEDIRLRENREKVELFKNYYFVCFNSFNSEEASDEFLEPINTYLLVFREGLITFHFTPVSHTANVRRRVRQLRDFVKVSSDWLCYAIIDDITDSFAPLIRALEIEIDFIEETVYVTRKPDFGPMIRRIGDSRGRVMLMLRLLSGKADVIKMFAKRCNKQISNAPREEIALYLGDIQDHIITMKQSLSIYEKMLSRSHANYLAQLQVESVNSNNRVTKVLGRVTLIGTILVPLNLVTGLFGMNVKVPGQSSEDLKWFFGVIGFIVTLVIIFSLIANNWIVEAEAAEDTEDKNKKSRFLKTAAQKINPFVTNSTRIGDKRNY